FFAQVQYALASSELTQLAGRSPFVQSHSQVWARHAPAVTHAEYCACVTSVRSISKAAIDTECAGSSSSLHPVSTAALQPISKLAGGTLTVSPGAASLSHVFAA